MRKGQGGCCSPGISVHRDIFAIQIEKINSGEAETGADERYRLRHHVESIDGERRVSNRRQGRPGRDTDRVSGQHCAPAGVMQRRAQPLYGGQLGPYRRKPVPIIAECFP